MTIDRQRIGKLGELEACRRLIDAGYSIKETNWRSRRGELDIIATIGDKLVFFEVRTRGAVSVGRFGSAAESVDYRKQQQVRAIAQTYMQYTKQQDAPIRFDVITILIGADDVIHEYRHYEAAF
ncbi:YraN family protein [Paenibacillus sp. GSMTC-2017]|uniref:YraN family protein n=1 Tax=Paenibacillus sp. GSMTC-2017 TaxID=2794350 RepID=UPI0018DA362A|nr:YraN family protein [Paenibacillus sp. GSMTC-2017]MBH5316659.1 YraN family protein [Paenibacillus sp. GSMTC-2017]